MTDWGTNGAVQTLLRQVQSILELREQQPAAPGDSFNVLSLLITSNQEELTHCRLLYELLRPEGSHGFGDQFLRAFFELVLRRPFPADAAVMREYAIESHGSPESGRIDLLIQGQGVCYPIEVKLRAEDQLRQIERYVQFAAKSREHQVYYLSLDGHEPSEKSAGGVEETDFTCLSFGEDIRRWLVRCGEIAWCAPAVAGTIQQYIALLDRLTGNQQGDRYMEMVKKTVGSSRENYESAAAIEAVLAPLRAEMMEQVFTEIEEHIGGRLKKLHSTYHEDSSRFYGQERRKVWPSLTYFFARHGEYTIALHIEVEWKLYHGLIFYRGNFEQCPQDIAQLKGAFPGKRWDDLVTSLDAKDWWLWYKYLTEECPIDFRHCNGRYSELFDPEGHQAIMEEIFAQLDRDIEYAQRTGMYE